MNAVRQEHDVLLSISRRQLSDTEVAKLRSLVQLDLDWEYLLATARQHGLLPLLHKHATKAAGDLIPGQVLAELKRESVANTQSVLHLAGKALKVAKVFTENEIPNAIFKGPLLAEMAYGEIGLRQAGDIDVLISRQHFMRAKRLLEGLGYQMYPQLTAAQQASHLSFHCEIQFMRDDWFTVVDLHWALTPRSFVFGLTGEEVMSRLQTVSFAGSHFDTFSREDLLLYQAMHGAKHLWRRAELIASLAELVRSLEQGVWPKVVEQAASARATKILGLGLRLVENLFDTRPPSEVLKAIDGEGAMRDFAKQIADELFVTRSTWADSTETNLYNLRIMDRKRDALVSALRAIFVPTLSDWEALSLPAPLHSLYYAVRPIRLLKVYSSALLRKVSTKPAR
jgi:hypothetical protein